MKSLFIQPLITEKSLGLSASNVYQFVVPTWATKNQIADHVEKHFGVTVIDVNTSRIRGEVVRFKNRAGKRPSYKKATVRLTSGQSIADFTLPVEAQADTPKTETPAESVADTKTESKITVRSKSKKAGA